jgi:hypothetical protein
MLFVFEGIATSLTQLVDDKLHEHGKLVALLMFYLKKSRKKPPPITVV